MRNIKIAVAILGSMIAHSIHAQQDNGTIETHEIKIVKDYNVFIEEATKLNLPLNYKPQFQDKSSAKKITYQMPDRIEEFKFEPSTITPVPFKSKLNIFKNENFIKLGAGSLLNPTFEWSHQKLSAKDPLQIHMDHNSAWNGNLPTQEFLESNLNIAYTKGFKSWKLKPELDIENRMYNFYGNIDESVFKSKSSRLYSHGALALNLFQEKVEKKSLSIYNQLGFRYGSEVMKVLGTTQVNNEILFGINSRGTYRYSENTQIHLQVGVESYNLNFSQKTDKLNLNFFPSVSYKNKTLKVNGGLNFIKAQVNSDDDFYILPKIQTDVQLLPSYVNLYTLWERTVELNTLNSMIKANPFASFSNVIIPNSLVENRLAGVKGSFLDLNYNTFIHQRIIKEALLFANDSINPRYLYSTVEKNMTINNLSMELSYLQLTKWDFSIKGDLFLYELDNLPMAFNLPGQRLSLSSHYKPSSKWNLQAEAYLISGVKSLINNREVKSSANLDLNLGAEYLVYKKFYIFANINNILNSKMIQSIGYPSYGLNGQLGFRFLY